MALVLLESRMCLQVSLEFPFGDEPFPALLAHEGLLFGVREAVQLQVVMQLEALVADLADVLLLLSLVGVVDGDLGAVTLEVFLQVVEVVECFAADLADFVPGETSLQLT